MPGKLPKIPAWALREEVLDYIIDAYAGTEPPRDRRGTKRRVFLWQEGVDIKMGNAEAFLEHLNTRFELGLGSFANSTYIHSVLRALGEGVYETKEDRAPRGNRKAGLFKQPEPESWVIRRVQ